MTQKEIARMLNLSISTVSLALKDYPLIKEATRKRVKELAKLTNYRPNLNARSLLSGKTFTVGVILHSLFHSFDAEIAEEINRMLHRRNYLGLFLTAKNADEVGEAVEKLLRQKVEGIILCGDLDAKKFIELQNEHLPVIFYDQPRFPADYVAINRYKGACLSVSHLIKLGHRKIGFVGKLDESSQRFKGYIDTLLKYRLPVEEKWIRPGDGFMESGYQEMKNILFLKKRPTAILARNDTTAIGAMRAIYEAGLKIPEDIAIVGFDDIQEARYLNPPLTTISFSRKEIAQRMTNLLMDKIEHLDKGTVHKVLIEPKLVVRESCGYLLRESRKTR